MASHRHLASNVGVGLLALSVLVLGAQANTAVMLASENQALASAPGNDGKNDNKNDEKKGNAGNGSPSNAGNGSPSNAGNGSPSNPGNGSLGNPGNDSAGNPGNGAPRAPGDGSSGTQGNGSPGAQQPAPPVATSEPAKSNPGAGGNGGNGGNGTIGGRKSEPTITELPSPWPTAAGTPGGGNPAQNGVHKVVGICHRTGSGVHYLEADDNSSLYQGHLQHGGDKFNVSEADCGNPTGEAIVVPSPSASAVTPTPDPKTTPAPTAPTAAVTPSATPTVVTESSLEPTQVAAEGTATPVAESTQGPGNGNGQQERDDDQNGGSDGDRPRTGGLFSSGAEGESRGDSSRLAGEIALSPDLEGLPAEAYGPNGEVLSGFPDIPQRMPVRQAAPASAAGGGNSIAQIPSVRPAAPAVLPTTGEGDETPFQGWASLGLVLFASGSILTRIGRRAES